MKPTQQEIIELAREAGYPDAILEFAPAAIERLVHLALERFGAGGGEPVAFVHWPMSGPPRLVWYSNKALENAIQKAHEGYQPDMRLYTHPSPDSLRDEYLRGLEDAKQAALRTDHMGSVDLKPMKIRIGSATEALKGKQ